MGSNLFIEQLARILISQATNRTSEKELSNKQIQVQQVDYFRITFLNKTAIVSLA